MPRVMKDRNLLTAYPIQRNAFEEDFHAQLFGDKKLFLKEQNVLLLLIYCIDNFVRKLLTIILKALVRKK